MDRDEYGLIVFGIRFRLKALQKTLGPQCEANARPLVQKLLEDTNKLVCDLIKEEPEWIKG